jgi:uncharacterized membrane protein YjgN (DUF898 family)
MTGDIASAETPSTPPANAVEFTGRRGPLFQILLGNAIFNLITLAIYRFWAKTWVRRYFWNNIRIGGDPLEYTGLPSELFIGFLIVLAVLVPFGLVFEGLRALVESASLGVQSIIDFLYSLALFTLIQVAFYRMWRYRLTRTTWRGIRFGLDGSTSDYLWLSLGWTLVTILTLGIAYPWMRIALMRYRIRHTRYGQTGFDFAGSGTELLKPWLIAYLLPLATIVAFFAINPGMLEMAAETATTGAEVEVPVDQVRAPWLMFGPVLLPFTFIWYRVCEFRYMVGCTRFADITFESEARTAGIMGIAVLTGVLILVLWGIFVGAAMAMSSEMSGFSIFTAIVAFLVLLNLFPILTYILLRYEIVKHVCQTLRIGDMAVFDRVVQSAKEIPARGEGLADAFDVGAI